MKSKSNLYELVLTPAQTCNLPQLPTGAMLEKALPGCLCSDLFIGGFSYKPLDLGVGIVAQDDTQYRFLKNLKSARYVHDSLRPLEANALLKQLCDDTVQLQGGYIGYTREVSLALKPVRLPEGDTLFGVQLRHGSFFRCFVKSETSAFPESLMLDQCRMLVQQVLPAEPARTDRGVLQSNLPLDAHWQVSDTSSRFKLSYDALRGCKVLCAGSVISRNDFFGRGVIL